MDFAQRVYAAAAKVDGMLVQATAMPAGGGPPVTLMVSFSAATELVLGDVLTFAPAIQFATADLPDLALRDEVAVAGRDFVVRQIERLHDGGETRAALQEA
jgi:hypothetical protein